jgi:hypothetical protein
MKLGIVFCLSILVAQTSWSQMNEVLGKYLSDRTLGADPFYGKVLAPALNLETSKTKVDRISEANVIMVSELDMMSYSFSITPAANLVNHMYDVVKLVDPAIIGRGGNIIFSGTNPSLAISRNLILIQKSKTKVSDPAAALMKTLTSYKHSAKPNDFVYEYSDATNLTSGAIKSTVGSDSSWTGAGAAPSFNENQDYVLKKCRQLLGWRCITSLYRTETLTDGVNRAQILFISLYDLTQNKDHAEFAGDKRSMNQITGSTAVYVIKETADYVMLYGVDSQYNNDKASFTGAILSEFQKDMDRFKQRISTDLGIAVKDIQ